MIPTLLALVLGNKQAAPQVTFLGVCAVFDGYAGSCASNKVPVAVHIRFHGHTLLAIVCVTAVHRIEAAFAGALATFWCSIRQIIPSDATAGLVFGECLAVGV